jgi:AraC-like DNA-binding protein
VPSGVTPQGAVHIWHEGIVFVGTGIRNAPHRHFTASLIFGIDGPFAFRSGRSPWRTSRAIATAPNAVQQMDTRGHRVAVMQVDPETAAYAKLAPHFVEHGAFFEPEPAVAAVLCATLERVVAKSQFDAPSFWSFALEGIGGDCRPHVRDARVTAVLDMIKREFPDAPSVATLARAVRVSPSRLIHLWKDEVGVSLRRYVLWLRLRHVVACVAMGHSLTMAAHEAGFADSAHLSRTFRSMFGLPLSSLFGTSHVELFFTFPEQELSGPHAPYDRERWATAARVLGNGAPSSSAVRRSARTAIGGAERE